MTGSMMLLIRINDVAYNDTASFVKRNGAARAELYRFVRQI
jgi:hypothetical protein